MEEVLGGEMIGKRFKIEKYITIAELVRKCLTITKKIRLLVRRLSDWQLFLKIDKEPTGFGPKC